MEKERKVWLIIIGILLLSTFITNYNLLDTKLKNYVSGGGEKEMANVTRVIDGDTIEINESQKVRLLGIDTPERGEKLYEEASEFLREKIKNKKVYLEYGPEKQDHYGRILAHVHHGGKNINLEIIKNGYSNYYFPNGKTQKYNKFVKAWKTCLEKDTRLCEKSDSNCSECIELSKFDYKNGEVILKNTCKKTCSLEKWKIHDEGGKEFIFEKLNLKPKEKVSIISGDTSPSSKKSLNWDKNPYVWTYSGDTLFLRDSEGNLILWENY